MNDKPGRIKKNKSELFFSLKKRIVIQNQFILHCTKLKAY